MLIRKMPSLQKLLDYVQLVKKTVNLKDISNELLVGVVEFQVERIPKYATVLGSLDERIGQIKTEILNMLKAHSHDLTIAPLNLVKFSWSEAFKANIYAIREDKKEIEPTSMSLVPNRRLSGVVFRVHPAADGLEQTPRNQARFD